MFTGIVEQVGKVEAIEPSGDDFRIRIATGSLDTSSIALGDSISVSGACLTVVQKSKNSFSADVSNETVNNTVFRDLLVGADVNLERALVLGERLDGHLVTGHVDGVGVVKSRVQDGRSERFAVEAPDGLLVYIARKGSICVDGVSLTVNGIKENCFDINIVPHTLQHTTLGSYQVGRKVNLEVDIIARYLERMVTGSAQESVGSGGGVTQDLLQRHGYIEGQVK